MTFNFQTYTFLLLQNYTEINFEAISPIPPVSKNFDSCSEFYERLTCVFGMRSHFSTKCCTNHINIVQHESQLRIKFQRHRNKLRLHEKDRQVNAVVHLGNIWNAQIHLAKKMQNIEK
jgi:hypothetical protein